MCFYFFVVSFGLTQLTTTLRIVCVIFGLLPPYQDTEGEVNHLFIYSNGLYL